MIKRHAICLRTRICVDNHVFGSKAPPSNNNKQKFISVNICNTCQKVLLTVKNMHKHTRASSSSSTLFAVFCKEKHCSGSVPLTLYFVKTSIAKVSVYNVHVIIFRSLHPPPARWFSDFVQKSQFIIHTQTCCKITTYPNERDRERKDKFTLWYKDSRTADAIFILLTNDECARTMSSNAIAVFFVQMGRYFNLVVNFIFLLKFRLISNKYRCKC